MNALKEHIRRARSADAADWRKAMSDNVATALLVYTGLNIFLTVDAIRETGLQSLAMLCLVILVAAIIPACHKFEKRWRELSELEAQARAAEGEYRRDRAVLWLLTIGVPFILTFLFKALA